VKLQLALPVLPTVLSDPYSMAVRVPLKEPIWSAVPLNPDPVQFKSDGSVPLSEIGDIELHPSHDANEVTLMFCP